MCPKDICRYNASPNLILCQYNANMFQPMVDYIVTKENTGVYNTRRSVHLPVEVELLERNER